MDFISPSVNPSTKLTTCERIPLINSMTVESEMTLIPNFFAMDPPSLASPTAKTSSLPSLPTFFFKNFFKSFPKSPSIIEVAASKASAVFSNFEKAFNLRIFLADLGSSKSRDKSSKFSNLLSSRTLKSA